MVGAEEAHLVGRRAARRWVGPDEPDFDPDKPPDYRPPPGAKGMAAIAGDQPFIMKPDGLGWLFAPGAVKDGPLPAHYEPVESPVGNLLYPGQHVQPDRADLRGAAQPRWPTRRRRSTRSWRPRSG